MSSKNNRQEARELVRKIRVKHGYISSQRLKGVTDPELRQEIELALLTKDEMLGSQVITVAKNLYSTKTRFIFELLQNADDNDYEKAKELKVAPFVAFHVHPDRIVVECNEDGFAPEHLTAICAIGKTSKTRRQGFIGEKGLGFKSVFMAAWKVHIQSGAFSFSFTHRPGDSGMGMISPEWEDDFDEEMPHPMTRITLYLHEFKEKNKQEKLHAAIREEFANIQAEFLLFIKSLAEVRVANYDSNKMRKSCTTYSVSRSAPNLAVLEKVYQTEDTVRDQESKYYHVTTHEATGLARNEEREYSEKDEASCAYSQSTVVLAFPVSDTSIPIIESQKVFAFLPVNEFGFSFIIQADFVTNANRQDILIDEERNKGLIDAVSDTFMKAVDQFCNHDTLKYQWMRYLPNKERKDWGPLWQRLVKNIANDLAKTPVLFSRREDHRRGISQLYSPVPSALNRHGDLLFGDGNAFILSKSYDGKDIKLLREYGLEPMHFGLTVAWARKDLARGAMSVMKSPTTSEDWHTRVAKHLSQAFGQKHAMRMRDLQMMDLIPLQDGAWEAASNGPFFFSRSNELDIPSGLDMKIISRCVTNPHRLTLFKHLGALNASESLVRQKILQKYEKSSERKGISLEQSIEHIHFLHQTHHLKTSNETYSDLQIYDESQRRKTPATSVIYVITDSEYGPWELLKGSGSEKFVNKAYFNEPLPNAAGLDLTLVEWLYKELDVEECVYLFDSDGEFSSASKYIRTTTPEKFLGALHQWYQQNSTLLSSGCVKTLRESDVICRGNRYFMLKDTYFPTEELEKRVNRLVEPDATFPWLHLDPSTPRDTMPPTWRRLLRKMRVHTPINYLTFALDMLRYTLVRFPATPSPESRDRLFDLYAYILSKYWDEDSDPEVQEKIRVFFSTSACIFVPLHGGKCRFACLDECTWGAPRLMKTKFALELLYQPFSNFRERTKMLWTSVLGIENCTWRDFVDELRGLKNSSLEDIDAIETIYQALNNLIPKLSDDRADIVDSFERDALVYAASGDAETKWYKPSQCIWSNAAWLRGKISLNNYYEDLEGLFVGFLGVKPVDLPMAIDELNLAASQQQVSVGDIKDSIRTVNSLLLHEPDALCSQRIAKSKIFPVKYPNGSVVCVSATVEFFINDREPLMKSFTGKVKFLDFTLEEVNQLQPFLRWAVVQDRYVSKHTREITSFGGQGAVPILALDRQIHHRAHALLRIAAHFNSPRTQTTRNIERFYRILECTTVLGTDEISSSIMLSQDEKSFSVTGKKFTVYITEDSEEAKVYIPYSKEDQDYTFHTILPQKLFEWMMTDPNTQIFGKLNRHGVEVTNHVLSAPRSRLMDALEDQGVAAISIENRDGDGVAMTDEFADTTEAVNTPGSSTADVLEEVVSSTTALRHALSLRQARVSSDPLTGNLSYPDTAELPEQIPLPEISRNDPAYLNLLDHAIRQGRGGSLPSHTHRAVRANRGDGGRMAFHFENQFERDCKIGAAGELFVFELLLHQQLTDFSASNWQSNMTRFVTIHPEYANISVWSGLETSDITYHDATGLLTRLFIEKGYLNSEIWQGKCPTYFIEVKTTASSCDTTFYMSKYQYRRMQRCVRVDEASGDIYVIFRVYYLGRDDMGLEIYLDPERLRSQGRLAFTAEAWTIVANEAL